MAHKRCMLDKQGYIHAHGCTPPRATRARAHARAQIRERASRLCYTYTACLVSYRSSISDPHASTPVYVHFRYMDLLVAWKILSLTLDVVFLFTVPFTTTTVFVLLLVTVLRYITYTGTIIASSHCCGNFCSFLKIDFLCKQYSVSCLEQFS
jgi:hypothetical protein